MQILGKVKELETSYINSLINELNEKYKEIGLSKQNILIDSSGCFIYLGNIKILHNSVLCMFYMFNEFHETNSLIQDEVYYI